MDMKAFFIKHASLCVVLFFVLAYVGYFSYLTVLRNTTLYSSYFDLGIMHQTVFNTYKAITSGDWSRFLELTNPYGPEQIKRMAIHNDIILAPLALLYFIHAGPETLLIFQTIVTALGAVFVYLIAQIVLAKYRNHSLLSVLLAVSYLLFPSVERANLYDFHGVVLATTLLLGMYYWYLTKKYALSIVCLLLALLTKEQVGLTTAFFGGITLFQKWLEHKKSFLLKREWFLSSVIGISIVWFALSIVYIIPHFRGGHHFALEYYTDFRHPLKLLSYIFHWDTVRYFVFMLGPAGFLALISPLYLMMATPEFAINLLSSSWNMRNIVFHYTAVINPFVIIASIYGVRKLLLWFERNEVQSRTSRLRSKYKQTPLAVGMYILIMTLLFAYFKGPLPFSREREVHPFLYPQTEYKEVAQWSKVLRSEQLKISTTGQLAPHFTSRRYYYTFSEHYPLADYIVLRLTEIYNYPEKDTLIPLYNKLVQDDRFELIYKSEGLEVYKKKT
jgi:uncharacterized membrane protein